MKTPFASGDLRRYCISLIKVSAHEPTCLGSGAAIEERGSNALTDISIIGSLMIANKQYPVIILFAITLDVLLLFVIIYL